MASVVLTSAPLAAIIVGFQYGVYEDIRFRFLEARTLKLTTSSTWRDSVYVFPPGFRPIYDCKEPTMAVTFLSPYALGLPRGALSDARLPLHLAIYEGDVAATQRILACRPDLASAEAIDVAFYCSRFELASSLMELRQHLPQLSKHLYPWTTTGNNSPIGQHLPMRCVSEGNVAQLELLRKYTRRGWTCDTLRKAIRARSFDVAAFLYTNVPESHFTELVNEAASSGMLALVQMLHRDGHTMTIDAVNHAIQRGHLDVVRFLLKVGGAAPRQYTILVAAVYAQRDIVAYLLSLDDDSLEVEGALAAALRRGYVDIVEQLLASGRVSVPHRAVISALRKKRLGVARCLLSHGGLLDVASIDAKFLGRFANDTAPLLDLLREFGINLPTTAKSPCAVSNSSS